MQRTVATSFDLFGTLVSADRPAEPATAVADALRERDVTVPADWATAYREPQFDAPTGAEHSLATHVAAALEPERRRIKSAVDAATLDAFDRPSRLETPPATPSMRPARTVRSPSSRTVAYPASSSGPSTEPISLANSTPS